MSFCPTSLQRRIFLVGKFDLYYTWPCREGILEYYSYMQTHGGEHFVYEMVFPPLGTGISVGVTDMLETWACRCEQADLVTNFHVDSKAGACH